MNSNNLYWSVFQNLEKEIINLSNQIHFDDTQIEIYSIKISELLIRTVVEVESISKELYIINGGLKPDNNELFFDTDCLNLLETKWLLSRKKIQVTSPNFYFSLEENQVLTPLKKANKRGSSSSDWLRAYQAIKHNRAKNLEKGNIKHLIRALAGLYILNLYYRDVSFKLEKDASGTNFDTNIGSEIFSVSVHSNQTLSAEKDYEKNSDFDECIYLIKPTDNSRTFVQNSLLTVNQKTQERFKANVEKEVEKRLRQQQDSEDIDINDKIEKIIKKIQSENLIQVARENGQILQKAFDGLRYEAVLNRQQY